MISILGLLVLIGVSFSLNMLLTRKEANNYLNSVKARYIAEAGIKKAIMDIRGQVTSASYNNLKNYIAAYGTNFAFGGGKYTLAIVSEEGKVNINTFDETDNNQLTILRTFPLTDQQIANIIDYRDMDGNNTTIGAATGNIEGTAQCKDKPFDTTQEIIIATGITKAVFDANKDKITVYKPIIRGGLLGKYYRNITGASPNVAIDTSLASFAKKVVELGPLRPSFGLQPSTDGAGGGWSETNYASLAGSSALVMTLGGAFDRFGIIWNGSIDIYQNETGTPITFSVYSQGGIKLFIDDTSVLPTGSWQDAGGTYSGNYTFQTAGWHKIRVEYYKNLLNPTVILQWNAGGSTVAIPAERLGYDPPSEVAGGYNHAGTYTITATASVVENGVTVATKRMTAVAEIFDTWTQTTKEEFYSAWFNLQGDFSDGEVYNVNWLDSCPTDEDYWDAAASKMHWEGIYTKTPNSVKLGYWDNFDEDIAYSAVMMKGYQWNTAWYSPHSGTLDISYQDFKDSDGDGDNEINIKTKPFEAKHFEVNRFYFTPNTQGVFVRSYIQQPAPSKRKAWRGGGTPYTGPVPTKHTPLYVGSARHIYYDDLNGNNVFDGTLGNVPTGEPEIYPVYDAAGNSVYITSPTPTFRPAWLLESIPAPGTYDYYQPEAPFCGCWIFAKGNADDPRSLPLPTVPPPGPSGPGTLVPNGFKTLATDGDGYVPVYTEPPVLPLYSGDTSEIRLGHNAFFPVQFNYPDSVLCTEVLSMIGRDNGVNSAAYYAWIDGTLRNGNQATWADWSLAYPNGPIFKFVANNQYLGWDWPDFDRGQHVIGPSDFDKMGAVTEMDTLWDDIRCMAESGYLVSVPFYSGSSAIRWGTVSYTRQTPPLANTNIDMYIRKTTTTFSATDSDWTGPVSSGAAVGGTEPWTQYKAVLKTNNAIDGNDYLKSSRTPVLEDVTITYMPVAQIKYWREGP